MRLTFASRRYAQLLRLLLVSLFGFLAISKLAFFVTAPGARPLVPAPLLAFVAVVEAAVAVLLATRWWRLGAWSGLAVGCVFVLAVPVMLYLRIDPSTCGCFGAWRASGRQHFLVACAICCFSALLCTEAPRADAARKAAPSAG